MTALMAAVAAATAAVEKFYPLGTASAQMEKDARGAVAYPYGVFSAALGRGDAYTLNSAHGNRVGGVTVQTFGRTVDAALDHMEKITDHLLDVSLDLPGCTPLRAAFDTPRVVRDPDDRGVIGATQQFTFTANKEA